MRKRTQARECALKILYQADMTQTPVREILNTFWEAYSYPEDIRLFAERIVLGTEEHLKTIDQKITQYAENWDLKRMAVVDRNILRLGAFELLYRHDVPPCVCLN